MMEIKKFKNAFGIKELKFNHNEKYRNHLIYASNGTFKSSFTKAMEMWGDGKGEEVADRISKDLFEGEISFNGIIQGHSNAFDSCLIYRVEKEEKDFLKNIQNLVVSKAMQNKLSLAKTNLWKIEEQFNSVLKKCKINADKYYDEFHGFDKESFYRIYNAVKKVIGVTIDELDFDKVDFGQFFSKAYLALFSEGVKSSLDKYATAIESRKKSVIFDENFTESNFLDVIKNLKKNNFISKEKERTVSIGKKEFNSISELEGFYKEIIIKVFESEEVINSYNDVKKQLGSAKAVDKIDENLRDLGFIFTIKNSRQDICNKRIKKEYEIDDLVKIKGKLESIKSELDDVYKGASHVANDFQNIIDEFKEKFDPIFDIKITNIAESVLGVNAPRVIFTHKSDVSKDIGKNLLDELLSSGEKSALYILEFMFRLKWKLSNIGDKHILVVMDDVIETFDYSNRNGFIEYINDLTGMEQLSVMVLTHNFEFYKTLNSRCENMFPYVAERTDIGMITISKSWKFANSIRRYFNEINSIKEVLIAIPFAREIMVNIGKEDNSILTSCVHYKKGTSYSFEDIINELNNLLNIDKNVFSDGILNKQYYELLDEETNYAYTSEIELEDKLIYSIASRVLIEKKAEDIKSGILDDITKNQTAKLYEKIKNDSDFSLEFKKALRRVVLITPNFVHINSFMYNPLVDINTKEYFELLRTIRGL